MASGERRTYRSSRREEQARATRQRVLAAATELFLRNGYAGSTVRAIAAQAGVSVPTVELQFGTKARLLKAAIDVAIVGDDEAVPVLDRDWADTARSAGTLGELLAVVADVLGPAQERSAGLVLAVFEGSAGDPDLAELSEQMIAQRSRTAEWLVDTVAERAALRADCTRQDAVDTLWILMDPAVFDRLRRHRGWTQAHYRRWFADSVGRLLIPDPDPDPDPRSPA